MTAPSHEGHLERLERDDYPNADADREEEQRLAEQVWECDQCGGAGSYVRGLHPDWGPLPCEDCGGTGLARPERKP